MIESKSKLQIRTINVGIDLGTSSSKVACRDMDHGRSFLLPLRPELADYGKLLLPSTIEIRLGHLYFGGDAPLAGYEKFFRSIKICLACQVGKGECRGCSSRVATNPTGRGHFMLAGEEVISAAELTTFYLAYLMKLSLNSVRRQYGTG